MTTPLETTHTTLPQVQTTAEQPPVVINNLPPNQQYFTADQLEAARQQEKDKLYNQLEKQKAQLQQFEASVQELKADKEARDAELKKQQDAAEAARRKEEESKLSAEQLIEAREKEFTEKQEAMRAEMDLKIATLEREQKFLQLKSYTQRRIAEEIALNTIIPDLVEFIDGSTEEEVEASITKVKEKTANIVKGATTLSSPSPGGVSPTGGPSGPLDNLGGPKQYTEAEIRNMNNAEYAAYRKTIGIDRAGNGQGLFG